MIQTVSAKRQFIANFGLNTFIETEWVRLRVPSLLRTFWLTRFTQQLLGNDHAMDETLAELTTLRQTCRAETPTTLSITILKLDSQHTNTGYRVLLSVPNMPVRLSVVKSFMKWITIKQTN